MCRCLAQARCRQAVTQPRALKQPRSRREAAPPTIPCMGGLLPCAAPALRQWGFRVSLTPRKVLTSCWVLCRPLLPHGICGTLKGEGGTWLAHRNSPPRPVPKGPSPWLPSAPMRTISPSTYSELSALMLPTPPRPCEISMELVMLAEGLNKWLVLAAGIGATIQRARDTSSLDEESEEERRSRERGELSASVPGQRMVPLYRYARLTRQLQASARRRQALPSPPTRGLNVIEGGP